MLSVAEQELICSAVDGDLTPEQDRAFAVLLACNVEAQRLHSALCKSRDTLAQLPRRSAPDGLHASIMARIQPVTPRVASPVPHRSSRALPIGMAASLLLAVTAGSYWLATNSNNPNRVSSKQLQQLPKSDATIMPQAERSIRVEEPDQDAIPETMVTPFPPAAVATLPEPPKRDSEAPVKPSEVLAAPVGAEAKPFERFTVKVPLVLPFSNLAAVDARDAFRSQLSRESAVRLDLFAKDSSKALELLTQAGKVVNLNLITETIANERLKRKMPSTWVVYTDTLTSDEVVRWMKTAADADAKLTGSTKTFGSFHLVAAGTQEQKDVQSLVGIDLGLGKKPRLPEPQPNGHISSTTLDQVAQAIQKGEPSKPAILLTYLPPLVRVQPTLSRDVKTFLDLRKDRKPNTLSLMIVIRQ